MYPSGYTLGGGLFVYVPLKGRILPQSCVDLAGDTLVILASSAEGGEQAVSLGYTLTGQSDPPDYVSGWDCFCCFLTLSELGL